ncbi:hypothetical protein CA223_13200 [Sphingomonas koreensis]|jgi:hypothetical protein|uniref:ImmA/IrrE family metallo-endopeptidase n=1 Tax=Sphingomonas koreensis TaxID=93064 RepID=A0A1L6J8U1_9SPHN|nr:hypothetical protein [Sphingomonas koreensis]APR52267.1 hypothetical protein BRX40_07345 [Sphingomonas koreensis]MDC7811402.1 hypothetical protein [Sphingomonas koreensis]PJI88287.1 hypothetical protein BDW16_1553 [Sphingomonas koreensis]RSU19837.1 hypothetical protein CA224_12450 [Sphingomonas koreensis]RSU26625.1 hypothetical protein CA222_10165 [Sphingomonas koreensis]
MTFADPIVARIVPFLEEIGIPVAVEPVPVGSLLPGATVRNGTLIFDPDTLEWPGDLLHEAGHIAVSDPATRAVQAGIPNDQAEEMAAMAWSYAAAIALEIDPIHVFHAGGYHGGGRNYLESYRNGGTGIGVPMLQYFGMSAEPRQAAAFGRSPFPAMVRWLR